jgi:hypothetical protein
LSSVLRTDAPGEPDGKRSRPCKLFGEIRSGEFFDVLQFLGQARWCGELVVQAAVRRSIFFDAGSVIGAESADPDERLGEVLCKAGVLTREQVDACSARRGDGPLRFGEVAVLLGFLGEPQLFSEMGRQLESIFSAVARLDSGTFYFFPRYDESRLAFRTQRPVEALLLDALRGLDEERHLPANVPSAHSVPVRVDGRSPTSDPANVYAAIDGQSSVEDLCRASAGAEAEVRRALFELVQQGHVTIAPPRLDIEHIVETYNQAIGGLLGELDAIGAGDDVRNKLVAFAASPDNDELFGSARRADDGMLDGPKIATAIEAAEDPADAEKRLTRSLYDYASFALFLARPHLDRRELASGGADGSPVATRLAAVIEPLAPAGDATIGPPPASSIAVPVRATSTQRMRRADLVPFPSVDLRRTVRLAPVSPEALARTMSSGCAATAKMRRAAHPRVVLPDANEAPASARRPAARDDAAAPSAALPASGLPAVPARAAMTTGTRRPYARGVGLGVGLGAVVIASVAIVAMRRPVEASSAGSELHVVCEPECGAIYVDGVRATPIHGKVMVTPGAHDVVVSKPGHAPQHKRANVDALGGAALVFELTPTSSR